MDIGRRVEAWAMQAEMMALLANLHAGGKATYKPEQFNRFPPPAERQRKRTVKPSELESL